MTHLAAFLAGVIAALFWAYVWSVGDFRTPMERRVSRLQRGMT